MEGGEGNLLISQNIATESLALMFEAAGTASPCRGGFANRLLDCLGCLFHSKMQIRDVRIHGGAVLGEARL